ncbi:MAG: hypothetical protein ACKVS9_17925 [Phycisphaerae bacterium]
MMAEMANSVRALAAALGKSHTAVGRWLHHPLWDQAASPPWDVERARAWAARTLQGNPADTYRDLEPATDGEAPPDPMESLRRNPLSAAKLRLTMVRANKLELERGILAGEYLLKRDVEDALIRRVHAVRSALQALPRQLAGSLVGMDELEIEEAVEDAIRGVLADLAAQTVVPEIETD